MKRQKTTQVEGEANEKAYTVKGTHLQSKHSRCVGTGSGESPQPNKIQGVSKKTKKERTTTAVGQRGRGKKSSAGNTKKTHVTGIDESTSSSAEGWPKVVPALKRERNSPVKPRKLKSLKTAEVPGGRKNTRKDGERGKQVSCRAEQGRVDPHCQVTRGGGERRKERVSYKE